MGWRPWAYPRNQSHGWHQGMVGIDDLRRGDRQVPAFSAAVRACCEKVKKWQHWRVCLALSESGTNLWSNYKQLIFRLEVFFDRFLHPFVPAALKAERFVSLGRDEGHGMHGMLHGLLKLVRFSHGRWGAWNASRWGSLQMGYGWMCQGAHQWSSGICPQRARICRKGRRVSWS